MTLPTATPTTAMNEEDAVHRTTRSTNRRRLLQGAGSALALGTMAACGGGGGGSGEATAVSPAPATNSGAPAGAFGGGTGQIAIRSAINEVSLIDLGSRSARRTVDQGTDSSLFGTTAASGGTHCLISRPAGTSNVVRLWIVRSDGSVVRRFDVRGSGFSFERTAGIVSADGTRVAIGIAMVDSAIGNTLGWGVCVVDVDGGNLRLVSLGRRYVGLEQSANPVWLADGRLLVQTEESLYLSADAAVNSLAPWRSVLSASPGRTTVDRAGTTLFFDQASGANNRHLWKHDLSSGLTRQLTTGNFQQFMAAVSPDNRWLMFSDNRVMLINGVPNGLGTRADFVCAIPITDQTVDLAGRDSTLSAANGQPMFQATAGLIGWI